MTEGVEYQAANARDYRKTSRGRTAQWRKRQRAAGNRSVTISLSPEAYKALQKTKEATGDSFSAIVERMILAGGNYTDRLTAQAHTIENLKRENEGLKRINESMSDEIGILKRPFPELDPETEADAPSEPAAPADPHQAPEGRETLSKAELLERVDAMTQDRLTYNQIAERFNADGIATPSGRGTWKKTTVANLVRRK